MCVEIIVKHDKEEIYCQTVGELAAALRVDSRTFSKHSELHCLCDVSLEQFGARRATEDEGWPFPEYIIEVATPEVKE